MLNKKNATTDGRFVDCFTATGKALLSSFLLSAVLLASWAARADIVFTAPPRESAQQADSLYKPIAEFVGRTLGEKVVFKQPTNWVVYLDMLVADPADLYFGEPHSVGFQLTYHKHRLLLRGPDEDWLVVARQGSDFRFPGRRACLLPPPDFGHMLFTTQDEFVRNPTFTAHVVTVNLYEDAVIGLIGDQCKYAAVPSYFYSLFPESYRAQLEQRPLSRTPGQAFTASSKLSEEQVNKLRTALLSEEGQEALKSLRGRFMNGQKMLPPGDPAPYIEQSKILVDGYLIPLRVIKP